MTTVAKYDPAHVHELTDFYVAEYGREPDVMELSWHGVVPVSVEPVDAEPRAALFVAAEGGRWVTRQWA